MDAIREALPHEPTVDWQRWHSYFADRSAVPLPKLDVRSDYSALPASLAASLAVFQLGESGGGTIADQARASKLPGIDSAYAEAMASFVAEEHRHANILAMCVRMLGGELLTRQWTARLFVSIRRMMGLRFKVLVLLIAEIVGICYYHLIASRLPASPLQNWLFKIVADERSHLEFHCDFLRTQIAGRWRRRAFVVAWRALSSVAAMIVWFDHRGALRDLGIGTGTLRQRWLAYSTLAEQLVVSPPAPRWSGGPERRKRTLGLISRTGAALRSLRMAQR